MLGFERKVLRSRVGKNGRYRANNVISGIWRKILDIGRFLGGAVMAD